MVRGPQLMIKVIVLERSFSVFGGHAEICHALAGHTAGTNTNLSITTFWSFEYTLLHKPLLSEGFTREILPLFFLFLLGLYLFLHLLLFLLFLFFQVLLSFYFKFSLTTLDKRRGRAVGWKL